MSKDKKKLTTGHGMPVGNDQNSMTAGSQGPVFFIRYPLKFPDFISYTNPHLKGKEK